MEGVIEGGEGADDVGEVRKVERGEGIDAGAYSEPYAPLPGWNNRS